MPERPLRPCARSSAGCPNLTRDSAYCTDCEPKYGKSAQDRARGSAAKRGYGKRWQEYRERYLRREDHVFCACGCGRLATDVDHIIPVAGPEDPLFWKPSNHQPLAHECHARKTAEDKRKGLTRQQTR